MKQYIDYHRRSVEIGDVDPQNAALKYICNRFELNLEQRYWLSFLFGCTYCAPTVYYIYNEFPDYENVDIGRLETWWVENKDKCMFQTDRLRVKTTDKFVEAFCSYRRMLGGESQHKFYSKLLIGNKEENYDNVFKVATGIKNFGRFSNFIYLELLYELTELPIQPSCLDVKNAESCRNGLCYATGRKEILDQKKISKKQADAFEDVFRSICKYVKRKVKGKERFSAWGIETTLCAYKKHMRGKRWVGYYIDRQASEIKKMEELVTEGVNWKPFWDFRLEYYPEKHLCEVTGETSSLESEYN